MTIDGDYDADGRADLAVYQRGTAAAPGAGQWSVARSSLGPQVRLFGGSDHIPVQGDFDGDGPGAPPDAPLPDDSGTTSVPDDDADPA